MIKTFLAKIELPDPLTNDFIDALSEVLSGLIKLTINIKDIHKALRLTGGPATFDELKKRFDDYVSNLAKGKDSDKVRIIIE